MFRADIPVGVTVHEYNATAAVRGADGSKFESRGLLNELSNGYGSVLCMFIGASTCVAASNVRYEKAVSDVNYQRKHVFHFFS